MKPATIILGLFSSLSLAVPTTEVDTPNHIEARQSPEAIVPQIQSIQGSLVGSQIFLMQFKFVLEEAQAVVGQWHGDFNLPTNAKIMEAKRLAEASYLVLKQITDSFALFTQTYSGAEANAGAVWK